MTGRQEAEMNDASTLKIGLLATADQFLAQYRNDLDDWVGRAIKKLEDDDLDQTRLISAIFTELLASGLSPHKVRTLVAVAVAQMARAVHEGGWG
jgi:hypothetical protein